MLGGSLKILVYVTVAIECGSFRPGRFGLGQFGLILGRVDSAYFGGSFRPV